MRSILYFFFVLVMVILIVVSFSTSRVVALLAPDYDFSSAVKMADLIVKGKVIETRSEWVDGPNGRNIFTYVHIRVDTIIKGEPYGEDIEFKVMGGTVGGITQTVSDSATFNPKEDAIVLLRQSDTGIFHIMHGYGKVSIRAEKISYENSLLSVDQFVKALTAFVEAPDSDFKQHIKLNQIAPLLEQRVKMDDGLSVPSLETREILELSHDKTLGRELISTDQSGLPDLQYAKLAAWDDFIVISNVQGTDTTASKIYDDQIIYLDFACGNFGSGDAGHFLFGLFIDGTMVKHGEMSSLAGGGNGIVVTDEPFSPQSAGAHTFKVKCDYNNEVIESNENNNEYSRTFTITARPQSGLPDLQPDKLAAWDDFIVISNVQGTDTTASKIYDNQTIYVDLGCGNFDSGDAGHFLYGLYIDGDLVGHGNVSSLAPGQLNYAPDASVSPLSAGAHTFKVKCDYNNEVIESNENNNEYSRTYTIYKFVPACTISSVSPQRGSAGTGTEVTIDGSDFGATKGNGKVEFWYGGTQIGDPDRIEAPIVSWSDTRIVCKVPTAYLNHYSASAGSGPLRVTRNDGGQSNEVTFIVTFGYIGSKWNNRCGPVLYRINENYAGCIGEGAAVRAGAETWNSTGASFSFIYDGTTNHTGVGENSANEIMWGNGIPSNVLALASILAEDGKVYEADIAFNNEVQWSCDNNVGPDEYDIRSVVAHELGHWVGLRDIYGDIGDGINDTAKIMYGIGEKGEVKCSLHSDDIAGILWIYPYPCIKAMPWIPLLLLDENNELPQPNSCGEGLPLTISDLNFPGTVTRGSTYNGSVAYQGAYEDIAKPIMALRFYTGGLGITTYRFNNTSTTNDCRINFEAGIPDSISGSGTTYFKLVDDNDGDNLWENNAVSNEISKQITIQ